MPWLALLGVSAIWGGSFAAIRYLVQEIDPNDLLVIRFVPVAVLTVPLALLLYRREYARLLPRLWRLFAILALIFIFGYHYILNVGETVLPASAAGLIVGTYPIFTILLGAVFWSERLTWTKLLGCMVAFAGTAYLMLVGAEEEAVRLDIEPGRWIAYALLTMLAPISAAVHTLIARPYVSGDNPDGDRIDPFALTLGYMAPGSLLALVFWRPGLGAEVAALTPGFWVAIIFLSVFCTVVAGMGWFWALQTVEAGHAAVFTYVIPLFSLVYARMWLGEPIGVPTMVGAAGIIAGVMIATVGWRKLPVSTGHVRLDG